MGELDLDQMSSWHSGHPTAVVTASGWCECPSPDPWRAKLQAEYAESQLAVLVTLC